MASEEILKPGVLVTGATGFVGQALVTMLVKAGYPVFCLVRGTSDTQTLQKMPIRLLIGDLELPKSARADLREIRSVFHLAGAIKAKNREEFLRINQLGTRRLLETLAETCPNVKRFIHVSSLAAAGPSPRDTGLREDEEPRPISWYGESKLKSEKEALEFSKVFRVTIVRPSAVYGPRDRETLMIFRMIKRGFLFSPGRLNRRFSLIHVDDLSSALIGFSKQDSLSGEVYFISHPEICTWEQIGHAISTAMGRNYRRIELPETLAVLAGLAGDLWGRWSSRPATISSQKVKELLQPSWTCDPSKAWNCLGFSPEIDLEPGIRETVHWYRNQGWL
jgi:dihydroflavonol-4-reductase